MKTLPDPAGRVRTLIADDEPAARRGVRLLLEPDAEVEIAGETAGGGETAEFIARERPDLVFLDVQMPGCDGFQVIEKIGAAAMPAVVFVTAHDEHALRAFEINAVDYLLKPYDDARFRAALARAKDEVRRRGDGEWRARLDRLLDHLRAPPAGSDFDGRILLRSSGEIFFIKPAEIDWIEADGDYMKFHVAGKTHLMRETMARLCERLDPRRFLRIHRSTIVNIDRVQKLSPLFAGEYAVVLRDGTRLRLSRGYHEQMQAVFRQSH